MLRFERMPIRRQLLALAILLTMPCLGIIIYSGVKERNEDYKKAAIETQKLADNLADRQQHLIEEAQLLGNLLSVLPDVKNHRKEKIDPILSALHKKSPQYQSIVITDKSGIIWASSIPSMENISIADRRYFRNVQATMQFSSGEYAEHRKLQTPTISMAYPLSGEDGAFNGAIIMSFDLGIMRSILQRSQLPEDTNYVLVDHKGIILSRGNEVGQIVGKPIVSQAMKQMVEGPDRNTLEFVRNDGEKRITTYRKLRLQGEETPYMYVRAGVSSEKALSKANRDLLYNILMLIPLAVFSFLLALIIGKRSISDRVARLQTAAQQIADGNLDVRVAHLVEGGELGELGTAFDEMSNRLANDILEIKRAEMVLYRNEARLRVIIETTQAGIIMVEPDGTISFANKRMAEMFGCSMDELVGSLYPDHLHPVEKQTGGTLMQMLIAGEIDHVQTERHYIRNDGSDFWGFLSGARLEAPDGQFQALIGIISDITDRIHSEEKLRQSEEKFSAIFSSSPDSININRLDDAVFIDINAGFTSMLGYTTEDLIGKPSTELGIWVDTKDRERLASQLRDTGSVKNLEAKLRRKDGVIITALVSSRLVVIDGEPCTLNIARDVTERELMQQELTKMHKLESLGVLAGGIAHDFNNILTGIMGNISFAKMSLSESNESFELLKRAEKASMRAADLAKQLLVFSKGGLPFMSNVSLQQLLQESISLALSGTNVKGDINIPVPLNTVEADEGQINQVIHNIIINAVQSMPDGGTLTVYGNNIELSEENKLGLPSGGYVKLSFTDEGHGISENDQKRIFDPYFTTKSGGSGLGLATSYAIIKKHGGRIIVDSFIGKGTTFTIYLPSLGEIHPNDYSETEWNTSFKGSGSILVMDDDETVRELAQMILERFGYKVKTSINGVEAVAYYSEAIKGGHPYSAVIMDLTIPGGMGGIEAARQILALDSTAKIIVSSGYSEDPVMSDYKSYGFCAAVEKPYKVSTIARILSDLRLN